MTLAINLASSVEALEKALSKNIAHECARRKDPFHSPACVFPNRRAQRRFQVRYADEHGSAANLSFPFLGAAIRNLLNPIDSFSMMKTIGTQRIALRLFRILNGLEQDAADPLRSVARYLHASSEDERRRRTARIAFRLADLFSSYPETSPEMWRAWRGGKLFGISSDGDGATMEAAQFELFTMVLSDAFTEAEDLKLKAESAARLKPPSLGTLHLFMPSLQSLMVSELLTLVSRSADLILYLTSPLRGAAGDSKMSLAEFLAGIDETDDGIHSWDRAAVEALARALRPLPGAARVILHRDSPAAASRAPAEQPGNSLRIVSAPGVLREAETVAAYLLHHFSEDESLKPSEVGIAVTSPEKYLPIIASVFARRGIALPLHLLSIPHPGAYADALKRILTLAAADYARPAVLAILENPCFMKRFGLSPSEAASFSELTVRLGIFRGIRSSDDGIYTWDNGMKRLRLGRIMSGNAASILTSERRCDYRGVLPFEDVDQEAAERYSTLIERLIQASEDLSNASLPLSEWADRIGAVADALLDPSDSMEEISRRNLFAILDEWKRTADELKTAIDLGSAAEILSASLSTLSSGGKNSMKPAIAVGGFQSLRGLSFRIVCIVGLDETAFPPRDAADAWNLADSPKNRSSLSRSGLALSDFSELVGSAREKLYLSYSGRDLKSDRRIFPSPVIAELIAAGAEEIEMPVSQTSSRYLESPTADAVPVRLKHPELYSFFRQEDIEAATLAAAPAPRDSAAKAPQRSVPNALTISSLKAFLYDPEKTFLRSALGIAEFDETDEDETVEEFEPTEPRPFLLRRLAETLFYARTAAGKGDAEIELESSEALAKRLHDYERLAARSAYGVFSEKALEELVYAGESRIFPARKLINDRSLGAARDLIIGEASIAESGRLGLTAERYPAVTIQMREIEGMHLAALGAGPPIRSIEFRGILRGVRIVAGEMICIVPSFSKRENLPIPAEAIEPLLVFAALRAQGGHAVERVRLIVVSDGAIDERVFAATEEEAKAYLETLCDEYLGAECGESLSWKDVMKHLAQLRAISDPLAFAEATEGIMEKRREEFTARARMPLLTLLDRAPSVALQEKFRRRILPLVEWCVS